MKKYKVIFEIHIDRNRKEFKEVEVEAGNVKIATLRAMAEIGKIEGYSDLFKNVVSVEEVTING